MARQSYHSRAHDRVRGVEQSHGLHRCRLGFSDTAGHHENSARHPMRIRFTQRVTQAAVAQGCLLKRQDTASAF